MSFLFTNNCEKKKLTFDLASLGSTKLPIRKEDCLIKFTAPGDACAITAFTWIPIQWYLTIISWLSHNPNILTHVELRKFTAKPN